jgi:hypothetical protein
VGDEKTTSFDLRGLMGYSTTTNAVKLCRLPNDW